MAYALALSPEDAAGRRPLKIAKTDRGVRQDALAELEAQAWLREQRVRLADLGAGAHSDDAFDAVLSAAGLLRCVLEGTQCSAAGERRLALSAPRPGSGSVTRGRAPAR